MAISTINSTPPQSIETRGSEPDKSGTAIKEFGKKDGVEVKISYDNPVAHLSEPAQTLQLAIRTIEGQYGDQPLGTLLAMPAKPTVLPQSVRFWGFFQTDAARLAELDSKTKEGIRRRRQYEADRTKVQERQKVIALDIAQTCGAIAAQHIRAEIARLEFRSPKDMSETCRFQPKAVHVSKSGIFLGAAAASGLTAAALMPVAALCFGIIAVAALAYLIFDYAMTASRELKEKGQSLRLNLSNPPREEGQMEYGEKKIDQQDQGLIEDTCMEAAQLALEQEEVWTNLCIGRHDERKERAAYARVIEDIVKVACQMLGKKRATV